MKNHTRAVASPRLLVGRAAGDKIRHWGPSLASHNRTEVIAQLPVEVRDVSLLVKLHLFVNTRIRRKLSAETTSVIKGGCRVNGTHRCTNALGQLDSIEFIEDRHVVLEADGDTAVAWITGTSEVNFVDMRLGLCRVLLLLAHCDFVGLEQWIEVAA